MFLPHSVEADVASQTNGSIHSRKDWVRSAWWGRVEQHNAQVAADRAVPAQVQTIQLHGNKTKVLSDLSLVKLRKASIRLTSTSSKLTNM